MKINLVKTATGAFWAADEEAIELIKNFKIGEVYSADIKLNQNYKLLQKVWVFFKYCAQHYYGDRDVSKEQIELTKGKLLKSSGYCKQVFLPDGKSFEVVPTSISYAKMSEEERRECYGKLVTSACKNIFNNADVNVWNDLMSRFF